MAHDRDVGGIRCTEVLACLGEYVDGTLAETDRTRVDAHVAACDWCERFGGEYAAVVGGLRTTLAPASTVSLALNAATGRRLAEIQLDGTRPGD